MLLHCFTNDTQTSYWSDSRINPATVGTRHPVELKGNTEGGTL